MGKRKQEEEEAAWIGPDGDGDCWGAAAAWNLRQAHTNTHKRTQTHTCTTSEIPAPPPTRRRTHGEAATEALSRPPFCLKNLHMSQCTDREGSMCWMGTVAKWITQSAQAIWWQTRTMPPQQMIGIMRSGRMRMQGAGLPLSVASLSLYKLWPTEEDISFKSEYVMACFHLYFCVLSLWFVYLNLFQDLLYREMTPLWLIWDPS